MSEDRPFYNMGDGPVQPEYVEAMKKVARAIDETFNGPKVPGVERRVGFVLLTFEFGDASPEGRCNYMSNAARDDVVQLFKDQIKRFEGEPRAQGRE